MGFVKSFFSWLFGLIFLFAGIGFAFGLSILPGLPLIVISFLLLPPIRKTFFSFTNIKFPGKLKFFVTVLLIVLSVVLFVRESSIRLQEHVSQVQAEELLERTDYFRVNRDKILSSAEADINAGEYQTAVNKLYIYIAIEDAELSELLSEAEVKLKKLNEIKKKENILNRLKSIPESDYLKNRELYQQLVNMYPDDTKYETKLEYYTKKQAEEAQKQQAAKTRKTSIEAQFSSWNGAHRNLEKVIKQSMNDPDSFEHVETTSWDFGDHLVVKTVFRGKNAFGGVVINSIKAKVSLEGTVYEIIE